MTPPESCRVPVGTVVARLRKRPLDVRHALGGRVLAIEIALTDGSATGYSTVFAPDGDVSVYPADEELPDDLTPHVRIQGTADEVLSIVLGETDTVTAVFQDRMELFATPAELTPRYPRLMRIVREEIWALLDGE